MTAIPTEIIAANRGILAAFSKASKHAEAASTAVRDATVVRRAEKALAVLTPALDQAEQLGRQKQLMLPESSVRFAAWAERQLGTAAEGGWKSRGAVADAVDSARIAVHNGGTAMSREQPVTYGYFVRDAGRDASYAADVTPRSSSNTVVDGQLLNELGWPARDSRGGGLGPDGSGYDEFAGAASGSSFSGPDGVSYDGLI